MFIFCNIWNTSRATSKIFGEFGEILDSPLRLKVLDCSYFGTFSNTLENHCVFMDEIFLAPVLFISGCTLDRHYEAYWYYFSYYRPQRSCGQGNIFTPFCHSVHRGVCLSACWDIHPPEQTTPPGTRPPPDQTPPGSRHPPPPGSRLQHTVYKQPVRILLECILVCFYFCFKV